MLAALLAVSLHGAVVVPAANVVVLGPGDRALQLCVAKAAREAGYAVTLFTRSDWIDQSKTLMYGGQQVEAPPKLATTNSEFGRALQAADGLLLCAENGGRTDIENTLNFAPHLSRIVHLSAIGGSRGVGGNLGEGEQIAECEAMVAKAARAVDVELAVVRVGPMKGGAGKYGLNDGYYDTLRIGGYPTRDGIAPVRDRLRQECARRGRVGWRGHRTTKPSRAIERARQPVPLS